MPSTNAAARMCQIWMWWVSTSRPMAAARIIWTTCVAMRIRRLSNRSATVPPYIMSASMGRLVNAWTRLSVKSDWGRPVITHLCAMPCIQVPVWEMTVQAV